MKCHLNRVLERIHIMEYSFIIIKYMLIAKVAESESNV